MSEEKVMDEDFDCEEILHLDSKFSEKLDDDLDFAYALSLQSEFDDEQSNTFSEGNSSLKEISAGRQSDVFSEKIDKDLDFALALSLQSEINNESKENFQYGKYDSGRTNVESLVTNHAQKAQSRKPVSIVDEEWEVIDPIPNIHDLFLQFNTQFFWGALAGVEVRWSPRMTLCAGLCCYEGRGGLCSVRLSQPLLKYRPRRDLVETLLHEMIHAYLFVTHNNKDHDAHGPEFLKHMNRINQETGTRITVYHSFHNEVDLHRKHWWKCNGPCQHRRPFFGLVKRAMNRAPSPRDPWWADHQAKCGGTFTKIKEPENFGQKKVTKRKKDFETNDEKTSDKDIRNFFSSPKKANIHTLSGALAKPQDSANKNITPGVANVHTVSSVPKGKGQVVPFTGKGFVLGTGTYGINNPRNLGKPTKTPKTSLHKVPDSKFGQKKPGFGMTEIGKHSNNGGGLKHTGTGTMLRRGGIGSGTIVLNKMPKTEKNPGKVETPSAAARNVAFSGSGHVLGGSSSGHYKTESQMRTPPPETLRQKSIDAFFESPSSSSKTKLSPKKKVFNGKLVVHFSSDSEDDDILESVRKSDVIKKEPEVKDHRGIHKNSEDIGKPIGKLVNCPVCGILVESVAINSHLDNCLNGS